MLRTTLISLALFCGLQLSAFEGVLTYRIQSGDREWKMECLVQESRVKAKILLGRSHFQSIHVDGEDILVVDELNKQIYPIDLNRSSWGEKDFKEKKKRIKKSDFENLGALDSSKYQGHVYHVDGEDGDYRLEVIEGFGRMHGVFLDQLSSLRALYLPGGLLFEEGEYMPLRVYPKGKPKRAILELESIEETTVGDEVFVLPKDYIRAKIRFKMR